MAHYVIVCEVIGGIIGRHKHIEVIRETLEDAISEIEITKYDDPLVMKTIAKEIFYGEYISGTRRFMYTFETKGELQISYVVHEVEENDITRNAVEHGIYNRDYELLEELS